jgi:hypothetical protein
MLDYYGSITKDNDEIIKELQSYFKHNGDYSPDLIKDIILDCKKKGFICKTYSYAGWAVFHAKTVCEIVKKEVDKKTLKNKQKLALMYSMNTIQNPLITDILQLICQNM